MCWQDSLHSRKAGCLAGAPKKEKVNMKKLTKIGIAAVLVMMCMCVTVGIFLKDDETDVAEPEPAAVGLLHEAIEAIPTMTSEIAVEITSTTETIEIEEPTQPPLILFVASVTDGDTVKMSDGEIVRIIGIDTPEMDQCGGVEAEGILAGMIENRKVVLVKDEMTGDRDQYGRLLRYIEYEGMDIGLQLIKQGWADSYMYDSHSGYPYSRESEYHAAQDSVTTGQVILLCGAFRVTSTPVSTPIFTPVSTSTLIPAPTQKPADPQAHCEGRDFANCTEVRAAGCAPVYSWQSWYKSKFDRDNDGVGCE